MILTVISIKVTGHLVPEMDLAITYTLMDLNIEDNGKIIWNKDKEYILINKDRSIKAYGLKIVEMDKAKCNYRIE